MRLGMVTMDEEVEELRRLVHLLMTDRMSFVYYEGYDAKGRDSEWTAYNHVTKKRYTGLANREMALAFAGLEGGDSISEVGSWVGRKP